MALQTYPGNAGLPTDPLVLAGAIEMLHGEQRLPARTRMLDLNEDTMYMGCSCTACAACAACAACLACLSCLACVFPPLLVEVTAAASASAIASATAAAAAIAVGGAVEATKG